MEHITKNIIGGDSLLSFWKDWAQKLEKKETIIRVSDFDYTLFSRDEQMEGIPDLKVHRGDLGPAYLFEQYGMSKFLEEYYKNISLPTQVLEAFDSSTDIIITAGRSKDFQMAKIRSCSELDNFTVIVTKDGEEKISELIRYILFELRYIPSEIIVYEDRPEYFVENKELIEGVLGTQLTIIYIEMDGNDGYKKIEKI